MSEDIFCDYKTIMTAYSVFGDSAFWPYIFLGNYEKEISCLCYKEIFGTLPTSKKDLEIPEVVEAYNYRLDGLRKYCQNIIDGLGKPEPQPQKLNSVKYFELFAQRKLREAEAQGLSNAGPEFLKNCHVDYGTETVAQIAQRLNISKAEVRRRKQNGEL